MRDENALISPHFAWHEFACHDGTPVPASMEAHAAELCAQLEVLRAELGAPVHIVSGYRTPAWNAAQKGAGKSEHMLALAADVTVSGYTPDAVHDAIAALIASNRMMQGGLGQYRGWTHYDCRGFAARWDNR